MNSLKEIAGEEVRGVELREARNGEKCFVVGNAKVQSSKAGVSENSLLTRLLSILHFRLINTDTLKSST